jgi:hypothetical protein
MRPERTEMPKQHAVRVLTTSILREGHADGANRRLKPKEGGYLQKVLPLPAAVQPARM